MIVTSVRTDPITTKQNILELIDGSIPRLENGSILAVTSKIVSICEGRTISVQGQDKDQLIIQEAEWYLPRSSSKYNVMLTTNNHMMIAAAGIDESNSNGNYVLWPSDSYQSCQIIWQHLRERDHIQDLGVIITDSRNTPTRWGAIGVGLAYCGFLPLRNYIGTEDIFGRQLKMTKAAILDGLAATAVLAMGEGNQQTPFAVIQEVNGIEYQDRPPNKEEIASLEIELEDDLYEPLLKSVAWKQGGKRRS